MWVCELVFFFFHIWSSYISKIHWVLIGFLSLPKKAVPTSMILQPPYFNMGLVFSGRCVVTFSPLIFFPISYKYSIYSPQVAFSCSVCLLNGTSASKWRVLVLSFSCFFLFVTLWLYIQDSQKFFQLS